MAGETVRLVRGNVLVAVLHELVRAEDFACYADLLEAAKTRAARLRIPYDGPAIQDAVRQVEHRLGRPLVTSPVTPPRRAIERPDDAQPVSRSEAKDLYDRLLEDERRRRRA